jgi:hypothetical protein
LSVDGTRAADDAAPASHYIAGFLSAIAIFAGFVAVVYYPGRVGAGALAVALVAAAMGGFQSRLATWAVGIATAGWIVGMIVSVSLERPVF